VNRFIKILLLVVLSVFSGINLSANSTFFSIENKRERVYSFSVEDNHSYIVGANQILVHNDANCLPELFSKGQFSKLQKKFDDLPTDDLRDKFLKDFGKADNELLAAFDAKPELVDAWKVLGDVSPSMRKNINELDFINNHLTTKNKTVSQLKTEIQKTSGGYSDWEKLADAGSDFLEEVISSIPASQRNLYHTNAGRFAPYDEAFDISLVKLNSSEEYVRVFKKSVDENGVLQSNKVSYWFMRKKDITKVDGSIMTPVEIKNKYALPEAPSHYTNVNLPTDKQVYRGVAKEQTQQGWGNGGGIQFELNETPQNSWFTGEIGL